MRSALAALALAALSAPALGDSSVVGTRTMTFDECLDASERTIANLNVPASQIVPIVNISIVRMTKIITEDGAIIVTCSAPDNKMSIVKSDR